MLRITAGEHRGRRLKVPAVGSTRPLIARAREALMDHLRELLPEARVWDVFAGSGILGFEALSRGADCVLAIERHPKAAAQLKANAAELGYSERFRLERLDARDFLNMDPAPQAPDLVFFDPPYAAFRGPGRAGIWNLFCDFSGRLQPGGCAVVHTPGGVLTAEECRRLPGLEERRYGSTSLYCWHKPSAQAAEGIES